MTPAPSIGRIVVFRSRTGKYDVPAIITATTATLNPEGVAAYLRSQDLLEAGDDAYTGRKGVPPLSSDDCVHLTVFTPGIPGQRGSADDFLAAPSTGIIGENVAGCYQEFDVPASTGLGDPAPGTWRWPMRV